MPIVDVHVYCPAHPGAGTQRVGEAEWVCLAVVRRIAETRDSPAEEVLCEEIPAVEKQ